MSRSTSSSEENYDISYGSDASNSSADLGGDFNVKKKYHKLMAQIRRIFEKYCIQLVNIGLASPMDDVVLALQGWNFDITYSGFSLDKLDPYLTSTLHPLLTDCLNASESLRISLADLPSDPREQRASAAAELAKDAVHTLTHRSDHISNTSRDIYNKAFNIYWADDYELDLIEAPSL